MRSVINYLSIYENREKVRKWICYLLIASVYLIMIFAPRPVVFPTGNKSSEREYVYWDSPEPMEMNIDNVHDVCLKYLEDYFPDYTLSRTIYRNNEITVWVWHNNGKLIKKDIQYYANILKIRFPEQKILVVYTKSWDSKYGFYDYRL